MLQRRMVRWLRSRWVWSQVTPNPYEVPCQRQTFRTAVEAIRHAATCSSCTLRQRALEAQPDGPAPHSSNLRRAAVEDARLTLGLYDEHLGDMAASRQVLRLASAISRLESALWYETGGRAGYENAHAARTLARLTTPDTQSRAGTTEGD